MHAVARDLPAEQAGHLGGRAALEVVVEDALGQAGDGEDLVVVVDAVAVLPLPAVALVLTLPEGRRPSAVRARTQPREPASLTAGE